MIVKTPCLPALALGLSLLASCATQYKTSQAVQTPRQGQTASGSFEPRGRPLAPPSKIEAGQHCVVELEQDYTISGTLDGSLRLDYRILVHGPIGSPPGTFDEEWIAHGFFEGTFEGSPARAGLTYVAKVQAGGEVDGRILLGQGIQGELRVLGNFGDGKLEYDGWAQALELAGGPTDRR